MIDFVKQKATSSGRMGQWSSTDLALQILSGQPGGEALAVFALNALSKSSLTISIPTPAFAALFHTGISSEE